MSKTSQIKVIAGIVICFLSLSSNAQYSGGTGEPNDPYKISTAQDLINLGNEPNDYDKYFIQDANIDLSGYLFDGALIAWDTNSIDDNFQGTPFSGMFDGKGYIIHNLHIQGKDYLGMFGKVNPDAILSNIALDSVDVNSIGKHTGGLVGYNDGNITSSYSTGKVSGDWNVGGLVGYNDGSITSSYSTVIISGDQNVGGLLGENYYGSITSSYSTGPVSGNDYIGGLVGRNYSDSISSSFWDIETSGQNTSDGGTGLITNDMQKKSTFTDAGWDFVGEITNGSNDIWRIFEEHDYPRLWWENIYVDDDAVGDPLENGRREHPFDTIQEAINFANDESKILVMPGVYGNINFLGKSITVSGYKGAATIVANPGTGDAVTFYSGEDSNSVLKNFIIKNSDLAISLNYGSNPTIRNITFVDNTFGIAAYEDSNPDIRNCIFYNNTNGDLFGCEAWYSCFEGGTPYKYNIDADPLFVDATNGDYHLKSEGWRWNKQSESWTWDDVTSPCIDAGDPNTPLDDEPMSIPRDPNNLYGKNNRINMGAYSGTPQASMPPLGWIPINNDDFTSPFPNPAQWETNGFPREVQIDPNNPEYYSVEMTAKTVTDASGYVEYYFQCTSESSFDSGWQTSPYYCVLVGRSGQGLRFRVTTRDEYGNQAIWSSEEQVIPLDISDN